MKKKFIAVNLTSKHEHQTKMSFLDDIGNEAFVSWWHSEGSFLFMDFIDKSEYFRDYFTDEGRDFKFINK